MRKNGRSEGEQDLQLWNFSEPGQAGRTGRAEASASAGPRQAPDQFSWGSEARTSPAAYRELPPRYTAYEGRLGPRSTSQSTERRQASPRSVSESLAAQLGAQRQGRSQTPARVQGQVGGWPQTAAGRESTEGYGGQETYRQPPYPGQSRSWKSPSPQLKSQSRPYPGPGIRSQGLGQAPASAEGGRGFQTESRNSVRAASYRTGERSGLSSRPSPRPGSGDRALGRVASGSAPRTASPRLSHLGRSQSPGRNGDQDDWLVLPKSGSTRRASRGSARSGTQVSKLKAYLLIGLLILALLCFVVYLGATYLRGGLVQTDKPQTSGAADYQQPQQALFVPQKEHVRNILLMGTDMRNEEIKEEIGERTDSMILLSLDLDKKTVQLCSFQRDMLVEMPGTRDLARLNTAYLKGADYLLQTINQNFALNIRDYVSIQMPGLTRVVDLMKGLEVTIPDDEAVIQELNRCILEQNEEIGVQYSLIEQPGTQTLNGGQVLAYCRMRKLDSDYERGQRQRDILSLIFRKFKNFDAVSQAAIIREGLSHVQTNLNLADLTELAQNASIFRSEEIGQTHMPPNLWSWTDDNYNILANLEASAKELYRFLYDEDLAQVQVPEIPGAPKVAHDSAIWMKPDSESFVDRQAPYIEGGIEAARQLQEAELARQKQAGYKPETN